MGCGESKHAVAIADAVLQRKKSNVSTKNGSKDVETPAATGPKTTDGAVAEGDAKVASENKTQPEQREEKQSDKGRSDGVVAEVKNVTTEGTKAEKKKEKEAPNDGEKEKEKEKKEGDNGGGLDQGIKPVVEEQLAEETKTQKENGEAVALKEEKQAKNAEAAADVEETKSSAASGEKKNVKDGEEHAADLPIKDSTAEEKK